uniref:Uncharacterized protein n=1 Tax=Rhizophora mucronata TaxID=61149 RepID=A0A2P2QE61_RHIMU
MVAICKSSATSHGSRESGSDLVHFLDVNLYFLNIHLFNGLTYTSRICIYINPHFYAFVINMCAYTGE